MSRAEVLEDLQTALAMELRASLQYQLNACILQDWGLDKLASKMREEMQEELGHADGFMARITFLRGEPRVLPASQPIVAKTLKEMIAADLKDEEDAIVFYTAAAKKAGEAGDIGSRLLFEKIAIDEEGHMAWLQLQLDLIDRIGEANYVAKHISLPGDASATSEVN